MDFLDEKLLLEMETFDGIFAKSAVEKERRLQLERDGFAEASQDKPREGVKIQPPKRYRLTDAGRKALAASRSAK